ncbi:hypothetical protein SAMN05444008_106191 [Cnuella takakiae]|uniref:Uncharacterized protein n=1 Tax=Cnuella takakiae TaxID=1302690 RepID=A0A1M5ABH5_9BACT|nr:hypothetical protein [Cnuella takakiae]OLY92027.1 hypothetical protein BUE76_09055 [Cnuella takakiae]SHF27457.1 hypothetical protein SAMN05444008_106191 [Cnuella takakiae]
MEARTINETDYAHIPGWGIDADPENDPTYPMKHWTGDDHQRLGWERPPLQPVDVEILKSIEHPRITAVFGTTAPPMGLSGMIRRYAFKYSESHYGHWLPLILADRVGVVEGIIDDLRHGHVPNIFAEKGWKAGWKYNKQGIITKVAVTVAVTAAVVWWLRSKNERRLEA